MPTLMTLTDVRMSVVPGVSGGCAPHSRIGANLAPGGGGRLDERTAPVFFVGADCRKGGGAAGVLSAARSVVGVRRALRRSGYGSRPSGYAKARAGVGALIRKPQGEKAR